MTWWLFLAAVTGLPSLLLLACLVAAGRSDTLDAQQARWYFGEVGLALGATALASEEAGTPARRASKRRSEPGRGRAHG